MLLFSYRHVDLDGNGKRRRTVVIAHTKCDYTGGGNTHIHTYMYMCVCVCVFEAKVSSKHRGRMASHQALYCVLLNSYVLYLWMDNRMKWSM